MAWQSPYRGEEELIRVSPRVKEIISRGVLAMVGAVLLCLGIVGLVSILDFASAASTQPSGYRVRPTIPIGGLLMAIGMILLGGLTLAAAVVPVTVMQRFFERTYEPPVTGDRYGDGRGTGPWWWPWI